MKKENKEIDKSLKLIAKTSIIVFIGILFSKIFTYVYRIIIARHFGPEVYGLFSLAFMVVSWFIVFFSFGMVEGVLRFVSMYKTEKDKNKVRHIFKIALIALFFSSIVSAILLFFLSEFISINIFHDAELIIFLKFFSLVIPIWILSSVFLSIIRAYEMIGWYSFILNILDSGLKVVFLIFFVFIGLKTNAIIFSFMIGFLGMLIIGFLVCKYKIHEVFGKNCLTKKERKKISKELFSYSWPLMFLTFLNSIFIWIDSFAIGYFKSPLEVGLYNAAVPLAFLLNFAPEIFMQLFFPLIMREFSKKRFKVIKKLSQQVGKWVFILNLPLFVILILFPESVISILFGGEYILASNALRLLAIGIFFSAIFRVSRFLLFMKGKSKTMLINILIASGLNIVLNIILVPKYNLNGAALSTTLSFIVLTVLIIFEAKYFTGIFPLKRIILRIILLTIIPIMLIIVIKQQITMNIVNFFFLAILFAVVYFVLLLITKCLDKNDFMIIKTIKQKIFSIV